MQYLFQCNCPASSEQSRYPSDVVVIIPACRYYLSFLAPSGRMMYVKEKPNLESEYLLDLQTSKKIPFTFDVESNHFLTDNLIFHSFYGDDEYILDISTGERYHVQRFRNMYADAYINRQLNLILLVEQLKRAEYIFLIDDDVIVALMADFRAYPENRFNVHRLDFPVRESNALEKFLLQNNIVYQSIPDMFPHEAISPNRKFIAREDGIYLIATGEKIVEGYSVSGYYRSYSGQYFSVRGWTYDSSGALYSAFFTPCLLETNFLIFEYPGCFVKVDQPLIKLKVPQEHLPLKQEVPFQLSSAYAI